MKKEYLIIVIILLGLYIIWDVLDDKQNHALHQLQIEQERKKADSLKQSYLIRFDRIDSIKKREFDNLTDYEKQYYDSLYLSSFIDTVAVNGSNTGN